eukprot:NODE_5520_length_1003_cov_37.907955_g4947_i0.p1 GENE.NODE_5520_length_1003_cov_37.907955_g4947_i0~~NODE_5520_length_1003_cov_37.907955_g4947_i0.p1  ORF type:complete len:257 (-),score=51.61 NODE_5520_length_1003_cov_37.907955_g4947_i0:125-895(-)
MLGPPSLSGSPARTLLFPSPPQISIPIRPSAYVPPSQVRSPTSPSNPTDWAKYRQSITPRGQTNSAMPFIPPLAIPGRTQNHTSSTFSESNSSSTHTSPRGMNDRLQRSPRDETDTIHRRMQDALSEVETLHSQLEERNSQLAKVRDEFAHQIWILEQDRAHLTQQCQGQQMEITWLQSQLEEQRSIQARQAMEISKLQEKLSLRGANSSSNSDVSHAPSLNLMSSVVSGMETNVSEGSVDLSGYIRDATDFLLNL